MRTAQKKEWFLHIDNENKGPLTLSEVKKLLEENQITDNTLTWKDGMENWEPIQDVSEIIGTKKEAPKERSDFLSDEEEFTLAERISILSSLQDVNKELPTQLSRSFPLNPEEEIPSVFVLNEEDNTIQEQKKIEKDKNKALSETLEENMEKIHPVDTTNTEEKKEESQNLK